MPARRVSPVQALVAAVLFVVGAGSAIAPLVAQSLADVARKEEERRKSLPDSGKVYTNKDLSPVPPSPAAPPSPPAAAEKPAKASDSTADTDKAKDSTDKDAGAPGLVKDQAYWAGRLKKLQDQLERDE